MNKPWYEDNKLNFCIGFEDTFIPQSRPGMRALDEYELTGHYQRWYKDLGLIAQVGANQVRWGIPWYLVNPKPHVFRFDWLDEVVDRFAELGLDVIVDLMHYGTPLWLDNSFINNDYEAYVAEYAATVADRYRGRLSIYTPLNEPLLNALYCGQYAYWPPYLSGDDGLVKLLKKITRGMIATQRSIKEVNPDATFVNVEASFRFGGDRQAFSDEVSFMENRRFIVEDLITGKVDEQHPLYAWLLDHGFSNQDIDWYQNNSIIPDVIGVNYYPKVSTVKYEAGQWHAGSPQDPMPFQNDGVNGMEEVLTLFADRYKRPVYLTETSWPGSVGERIDWLKKSVQSVVKLRAKGMSIIGYTWWALFDMIYWRYRDEDKPAEEYLAQMGLWDLVPDGRLSFNRVKTSAADTYLELVERYGSYTAKQ